MLEITMNYGNIDDIERCVSRYKKANFVEGQKAKMRGNTEFLWKLKNKIILSGYEAVENGEIPNARWEPNRRDVKICLKIEFSAKSWYFN